jgi:glyoxylase-like metal-dependent hydrolase (beta-lactamase superfamily II)
MQAPNPPSLRIGAIDVLALSDGPLKSSLDRLIGMAPADARALVGGDLFIPVNNFLLTIEGRRVLIDAGSGHAMQPTLGRLPQALRDAGVPPDAIDTIVLTHIHPDHANGLLDEAGAPRFPNAEIIVRAKEAAFWLDLPADTEDSANARRYRPTAQRVMAPYRARTRRVADEERVLGCLTPLPADGHTPGHTAWLLEGGNAAMLFWGDVVHLAAVQVPHPDVALTYDIDPDQARRTRRRLFEMAVAERMLIGGAHVDAPGIGRLVHKGGSYGFEPVA